MSDTKIILDTNVTSYLMRGGALAETYLPHLQGKLLAVAFITVGEMYYGAEKANWGATKRKKLETELRNFVIIPYDHEIARCYGRLVAERNRAGAPIAPNDAWIAACAVRHAVPLVTHNAKHFRGISGLSIITEGFQPLAACESVNLLREPDAGDPHVRFDEREVETERALTSPRHLSTPPLFVSGLRWG